MDKAGVMIFQDTLNAYITNETAAKIIKYVIWLVFVTSPTGLIHSMSMIKANRNNRRRIPGCRLFVFISSTTPFFKNSPILSISNNRHFRPMIYSKGIGLLFSHIEYMGRFTEK